MNKSESEARKWLVREKNLKEGEIVKTHGTPDFLTPIGGFEVKKLYGDKIIFYGDQLEELARFPDVKILVFNGNGKFVREALYSEIDLTRGILGDWKIIATDMTTIQVKKSTAKKLQARWKFGDTYDAVINRLFNGRKPEEKGDTRGDG